MERLSLTKSALARNMGTSRSQVERLLDPSDTSLTLATLAKASAALGMQLEVRVIVPRDSGPVRGRGGKGKKAA